MENCFVLTLNGSADADLSYFGKLKLFVSEVGSPTEKSQRFAYNTRTDMTANIKSEDPQDSCISLTYGGTAASSQTLPGRTSTGNAYFYVENGDHILLLDKLKLKQIGSYWENADETNLFGEAYNLDLKELKGCEESLEILGLSKMNVEGSFDDLIYLSNLKVLNLNYPTVNTRFGGNINGFLAKENFPLLNSFTCRGTSSSIYPVEGNLGSVTCPLTSIALAYSHITGNLEDFVHAQRSVGRTTGSMTITHSGVGQIKFLASDSGYLYVNSPKNLTWDASTMSYNGRTENT